MMAQENMHFENRHYLNERVVFVSFLAVFFLKQREFIFFVLLSRYRNKGGSLGGREILGLMFQFNIP